MKMQNEYMKRKWTSLITFAVMYVMVYMGRFNTNYFMNEFTHDFGVPEQYMKLIEVSIFFSYAAGCLINGFLADRHGAKKMIVIGVGMSIALNISLPLFPIGWLRVLITQTANGYFQSMIWTGGISMIAGWWRRRERGLAVGIANFASGMSHAVSYIFPMLLVSIHPGITWRENLIASMMCLLTFAVIFAVKASEAPKDNAPEGAAPEQTDQSGEDAGEPAGGMQVGPAYRPGKYPWALFFKSKSFLVWCCIAMFSGICRYGLIQWIPLYYNQMRGDEVIDELFLSLTLPLGMAVGTFAATWICGMRFSNNKGLVVLALAAMCGTMIIVFPMMGYAETTLMGIFCAGSVLYGINGIFWLYAIDYGGRKFAGSAAGILNGFAYIGAGAENLIFPFLFKAAGNYIVIFVVMEFLCIGMMVLAIMVTRKNTRIIPEEGVKV